MEIDVFGNRVRVDGKDFALLGKNTLGNHTVHITDIEFRGKFGSSHTRTFMTREEAINFVELLARGII
jgi:hypothetical protein